jgi:hypothetical protein
MHARVARFEGASAEAIREFTDLVAGSSGPPEGVPSTGISVLFDAASGSGLVIGYFDTEEDLRAGDAALRAMDMPVSSMPSPTSVEMYEVAVERRA